MSGKELRRYLDLLRPVCVPRNLVDSLTTMASAAALEAVHSIEFNGRTGQAPLRFMAGSLTSWPPPTGWSLALWLCVGQSTLTVRIFHVHST